MASTSEQESPQTVRVDVCRDCGERFANRIEYMNHRRWTHPKGQKAAEVQPADEKPDDAPADESEGPVSAEGSPAVDRMVGVLTSEMGSKYRGRINNLKNYATRHAANVFRSPAALRNFLARGGILVDVRELVVMDLFPDAEPDSPLSPMSPYGPQPAQPDPALAELRLRVDQLMAGGNQGDDSADKLLEVSIENARLESELKSERALNEIRGQLAELRASIAKSAAPMTAEGEVEDRRSDRLLRVLDRVDRRAASGFAMAQAMMMKQMGYSDAQIADAVRVAQQTIAGDAAEDDPKAAAMRREMAKKWVREGALETAPANPGGVVPAFSFPPFPSWPIPPAPKPAVEEPTRPDPAQWCSCHVVAELPKESWGFETRHEQTCRWVQRLRPPEPEPQRVTL